MGLRFEGLRGQGRIVSSSKKFTMNNVVVVIGGGIDLPGYRPALHEHARLRCDQVT
jgi:hypothetical protein